MQNLKNNNWHERVESSDGYFSVSNTELDKENNGSEHDFSLALWNLQIKRTLIKTVSFTIVPKHLLEIFAAFVSNSVCG